MTTEEILDALRALPAAEQREILRVLAHSLGESGSSLVDASSAFWTHRSIDELADEQGIRVAGDLGALAMPDWPEDEAADDLVAYVRSQRTADLGN